MTVLSLNLRQRGHEVDPQAVQEFRQILSQKVGDVAEPESQANDAKGVDIDFATIAVSVLSAQAVESLVGVIKGYFARDPEFEIEVKGDNWRMSFKGDEAGKLSGAEMAGRINKAIGTDG